METFSHNIRIDLFKIIHYTLIKKETMKILLGALFFLIAITSFGQTFHIYGGRDHDVYLGCLNCDKFNSSSIWNAYGTYGSRYNTNSIWNAYGTYGSKYNSYSPWNSYSNDSPVIVDKEGNFYGYFTLNKYRPKRANFDLVEILYENYDLIREDVSKWYDKLFN
jgi:hypothetical protein